MKKIIILLITISLLLSLISCKGIGERTETDTEDDICVIPSGITYHSMNEYITAITLAQKDVSSELYNYRKVYIPIVNSDDLRLRYVNVQDEYIRFSYEYKRNSAEYFDIRIYRPEATFDGYPEITFENSTSDCTQVYDNGYAFRYNELGNSWTIDLEETIAIVDGSCELLLHLRTPSDVETLITFKELSPNTRITTMHNYNFINRINVQNHVSGEVLTVSDERKENFVSIIDTTEWEFFAKKCTPDLTFRFGSVYTGTLTIEIQYVASSGLLNNVTLGYHCYVSEVERVYLNSAFGLE